MATLPQQAPAPIGGNNKAVAFGYGTRPRWATVRIETDNATYVGKVYVPESRKRLSDVLCDERPFLSMTEVTINDSVHVEPFVALNKQFVKTVRVLRENEEATVNVRR